MAISYKFLKNNLRLKNVKSKEIQKISVAGEETYDHQQAVQLVSNNRNCDIDIHYADGEVKTAYH